MTLVIDFPVDRISKGVHTHWPELNERKVAAQIDARLSYDGKHYFLRTKLELKGRGISLVDHDKVMLRYKVTIRAFEKIKLEYSISMERLLD
ncbi:hypothetical protein ABE82_26765 (plasmid) [Paenibacillus peoriae]|uniref:hypothetical protein n=1 Tax=Paenibacillus peoriae TaxID=59893 RepID=UPI00071FFD95|nr:hypothetical protein [Paenibacillus peoriae]ALS10012.1 hypothetical protein ABE82_26765 [Paenibacillus peoriae]